LSLHPPLGDSCGGGRREGRQRPGKGRTGPHAGTVGSAAPRPVGREGGRERRTPGLGAACWDSVVMLPGRTVMQAAAPAACCSHSLALSLSLSLFLGLCLCFQTGSVLLPITCCRLPGWRSEVPLLPPAQPRLQPPEPAEAESQSARGSRAAAWSRCAAGRG
jgi:hypothetical protein